MDTGVCALSAMLARSRTTMRRSHREPPPILALESLVTKPDSGFDSPWASRPCSETLPGTLACLRRRRWCGTFPENAGRWWRAGAWSRRGSCAAPALAVADEETLIGSEAFDRLELLTLGVVLPRQVGEQQAAQVGNIFAQRQLAVDLDVVDDGVCRILVEMQLARFTNSFPSSSVHQSRKLPCASNWRPSSSKP